MPSILSGKKVGKDRDARVLYQKRSRSRSGEDTDKTRRRGGYEGKKIRTPAGTILIRLITVIPRELIYFGSDRVL